jgi:hypothetical protein
MASLFGPVVLCSKVELEQEEPDLLDFIEVYERAFAAMRVENVRGMMEDASHIVKGRYRIGESKEEEVPEKVDRKARKKGLRRNGAAGRGA